MRFPITGSGFERAYRCIPSTYLPQVRRTTQEGIRGVKNHAPMWRWFEASGLGSAELFKAYNELSHLQQRVADGWAVWSVEPAYALDLATRTSRWLGNNIGRDYEAAAKSLGKPLLETEICLTLDLVGEHNETQALWIIDWKSSKRQLPPQDNLQIRSAVCAVMCRREELFLPDVCVGALGYLDTSDFDSHVFDKAQIEKTWDDLEFMVQAWRKYQEGTWTDSEGIRRTPLDSAFHVGPWCDYCPAFMSCDAQSQVVKALVPELKKMPGQIANYSPQEVGMLWDQVRTLKDLAERAQEALLNMAIQYGGRVPMPDGKRMLKVWRHSNEGVDWGKVAAHYRNSLGELPKKRTKEFTDHKVVNATPDERMKLGTWETGALPEESGLGAGLE